MDVHGIMISVQLCTDQFENFNMASLLPWANPGNLNFLKFDLSNSPPPMQQMSSHAPL